MLEPKEETCLICDGSGMVDMGNGTHWECHNCNARGTVIEWPSVQEYKEKVRQLETLIDKYKPALEAILNEAMNCDRNDNDVHALWLINVTSEALKDES